jgi:hypothetical protein
VKNDTVFNGDCGLQAVAIALNYPFSLKELRALMVKLITYANTMTADHLPIKDKITAMLAIFNNDITNFKQYFLTD